VRNEVDQNAVEQIDVIGPEARSPKQEQFGDPPARLGAAFGIAMFDDLIELGDQGGSECHQTHSKPPDRRVSGNLGGLHERRVRLKRYLERAQNRASRLRRPCRIA
jgi:hypothetical protein